MFGRIKGSKMALEKHFLRKISGSPGPRYMREIGALKIGSHIMNSQKTKDD